MVPSPRILVQVRLDRVSQPYVFSDVLRLARLPGHGIPLPDFLNVLKQRGLLVTDAAGRYRGLVEHLQSQLARAPARYLVPFVPPLYDRNPNRQRTKQNNK